VVRANYLFGRFLGLLGLAGILLSGPASAQAPDASFPNRPIKIISASPAGGGVDLSARIIADQLQKLWAQPVTVENRTGGSNNIAGEAVAKAEPDGYTLLATPPGTITANAAALEPVAIMAVAPNVLSVKSSSPAKTVTDLIAHAKASPGKISYASQGNGSTSHLTAELFASRSGVKLVHVPYRGAAPAVNDLAGGHVDMMFCDLGTILPLHQVGKVAIIAVATLKQLPQLPATPTIDESGVRAFTSTTFYSLMAPPKTPAEIRAKLNTAIVNAMQTSEAQAKLKAIFVEASSLGTKGMGEFVKAEAQLWGSVIRAANIAVEQ
jgi:tripartite-type tricarboxylate transporter receptor subunit TctC